jgi:DNA-binding transcriptional regulator LsrR (DeoR family)
MTRKPVPEQPPEGNQQSRLDDAARAGWLYYVAGNTQDEIARKLNVSRPTAQRLVALALAERLISFRLEHPIAACMELAAALSERYELEYCEIAPSDPKSDSVFLGTAERTAAFLEQRLRAVDPLVVAIGTGRTLLAAVERMERTTCPRHRFVSLVGHIR